MSTFQQSYSILASDMDITYHITPNAMMLYFQDCFARYLSSKRLAAFDIIKDHLIWVISDFELKVIRQLPLWSSTIKVEIKFREITGIRMYVDYTISNHNNEIFAEGSSIWVILNQETKRPFSPVELLSNAGITASHEIIDKWNKSKESEKRLLREIQHLVNVTDLDFNGHVCNRTYMDISMSTLPLEFIKTYSPRYIHIKFVRESFIGESLTCKISRGLQLEYWFDIVNEKGKDICNIYTEWQDNKEELSKNVSELIIR